MSSTSLRALACILAACGTMTAITATAAPAVPPPVPAFGATPTVSNVTLSPSSRILASAYSGKQVTIVLLDLDARKIAHSIKFDQGMKLRDLEFANDETLIAVLTTTVAMPDDKDDKREVPATFAIRTADGSSQLLLSPETNKRMVPGSQQILSYRTSTPGEMLMQARMTDRGSGIRSATAPIEGIEQVMLSVDTRTGKSRIVMKAGPQTAGWIVDTDGKVVARVDRERKTETTTLLARRGDAFVQIHERTGRQFRPVGYDPARDSIIAIDSDEGARAKAWSIPLDGSAARVLYEDLQFDVEGTIFDRTGSLLGLRLGGLDQRFHWFDQDARSRQEWVSAAFPGRRLSIDRYRTAGRALVGVSGSGYPGTYYLVDFATGRAEAAGQEYPQLAGIALGEVRLIDYKARDGYSIPAYLTLPPGIPAKGLPMVVLPHGGPEARDGLRFDWWAQFLASRGYLVLQPQFRGSTGFGEAHRKAGYRQWGKRMQDDVSDGVKAMVEQGMVDPKRVCIVGASYGGYAALAGATLTPELYACAVSIAGVADLPAMINWVADQSGEFSESVKYWNRHIGEPDDRDVIDKSPVNQVASVRAPVMLMHGIDDTVVPYEQSELMEKALKKAGKPYQLVRLDGEDHWLSRSETRTKMLAELEAFLAANLGPRAAGP
ncbi:MAG: S9 family peptidase [Gammaproteobacteria bacterium]|nr:S9 family peptidase [Gammaproteobacteria bacterium]